ncbi:flagellin N-terminal helical domain-containing protein [Niallia taxi]|uniref:flagellin N-terminal helical domain-containing protein n=1 Tax=Niallia taxi TaxID=2499688 RepID=UPI0015F3D488|nr:flagellin [Niallia taxi]
MRINTNMAAINAHRNMTVNVSNAGKSMEKLSSGSAINRAADNASGLAISEKMRGQIRGLEQAQKNSQDGISMIQTAEGALNETHSILQRVRELAVNASNGTNAAEDKQAIQDEIGQLTEEMNSISSKTEFNGTKLLDGSLDVSLQTGANAGEQVSLQVLQDMSATGLGIEGIDVTAWAGPADFDTAIETIDTAINTVSSERSKLGAMQNRLDHTINNLATTAENTTAAESRIRDTDMAKEMMSFQKNNILNQAAQAMMSQANQQPQGVLQLLR